MADYVSGEDQPYDDRHTPRPVDPGTRPCGNAWYAPWPASGRCTYVYGSGGDRCSFVNGDAHHNHRTDTGLGYMHQDQWRPVQGAATVTDAPGKRSDDEIDKMINGLRRKVRAQANKINKLEELRRAAVDKQPEFQALKRHLDSRVAELDRDRHTERERGDRFQEELRKVMNDLRTDHVDQVRHNNDRFYRLAALLTDDTAGETWDTLLQRVADLKAELEVERVRANARKAELDKQGAARLFMGPSAEYGTTPLAARVAELAKDLDSVSRVVAVLNDRLSKLETGAVSRCESRHGDQRCVMFVGHMGPHHAGPEAERWV